MYRILISNEFAEKEHDTEPDVTGCECEPPAAVGLLVPVLLSISALAAVVPGVPVPGAHDPTGWVCDANVVVSIVVAPVVVPTMDTPVTVPVGVIVLNTDEKLTEPPVETVPLVTRKA